MQTANKSKSVSIVIPLYNEKENLPRLLEVIEQRYKNRIFDFEVIFVDDGSDDGTGEVIKCSSSISFPFKLIIFSRNFGSHSAVRAGFLHATNDYTICIPADLQINLNTVEQLYGHMLEGYDLIYGIRADVQMGFLEKIFSRSYAALMRTYVNKDYTSRGIETIMINSKVRTVLNNNIEANSSVLLQLLSMGFKHKFVEIEKFTRSIGVSKWTVSKKIKLLIDSFVAFSYAPIRMVSVVGFAFFIVGILWTVYIIGRKLLLNDLAAGWPMLTSILLLGFGITNIGLGIIAEYLWRTLDASRRRPVFIIDEIIELNSSAE